MRRLLETCEPHKSGPFVGTNIGYDPDNHNANCRLTPADRDTEVERFTRELGDDLAGDKAITNPIADPRALLRSLTPEQRDRLYQHYQQNKESWADEAANQAALQEELRKDPALARELEAEIARRRAEWQDATSKLTPWQRQKAAPWLYSNDYTYFAPTLTEGPDGKPEFGFAPTPALRRLQLMQGLLAGVQVFGNADEALYLYRRDGDFRHPMSDEEALGWYQILGSTRPDKLAEVRVSGGGLVSSNSDLQLLVPTGALRGAIGNLGSFLFRITGEIASNAAWAVAADQVAEKYGPAAGAAVPFLPTLVGLLRRTVVAGAASKAFARRPTPQPKKPVQGEFDFETGGVRFPQPTTVEVPSVKGGAFHKWFNDLTPEQIKEYWHNPKVRATIETRLRSPRGFHEWLPVSRAPKFREWGVTAEEIQRLRTPTREIRWKPGGVHGGKNSTIMHNELLEMVDSSPNYATFLDSLRAWADRNLVGGAAALPDGLRSK
jgi:hypothetical protein